MTAFWNFGDDIMALPAILRPGMPDPLLSYGDLDVLAEEWRGRIVALAGAEGRPLVVLEFETSLEAIAAYLGCLRAGLPLLVLEPGQLSPESDIARVYAPELVIARRDGEFALRAARPVRGAVAHPDLALLLSTSGSTGDPKLVRLSGPNIDSNARAIAEYLGLTPDDRAMTTLPLFYSYGISVLNSYLAAGAALVLTGHSVVDPAFWGEFRAARATSLALVPHQFELLDRSGFAGMDLPSLRYVTQAGGRLAPDLVRRFTAEGRRAGWQLFIMYGQTEAAPRIAYVPPEALPAAADTIGRPIPGGRLSIRDEDGAEITAPGRTGELVYEGPNVMMGYAISRADLARPKEVRELMTGDLAELTAEGFYRITGRLKRFVKLFGLRLSLDQIEALLEGRGITAHAVAVEDRLMLLLPDASRAEEAQAAVAREYELPPAVIHAAALAELPLLPSGKTDHRALARIAAAELERAAAAAPPPGTEGIAALLRQATRARSVGPDDSFTALGGDSLGYLQVQMGLEARLGRAPDGWENMTLAELEALEPARPGRWSRLSIDVILRIVATSLVVAQHASALPLYGGTWVLILLMGFSASRFQMRSIVAGEPAKILTKMLYPILPFYLLLIVLYAIAPRDALPLSYMLLLGNYHVHDGGWLLGVYWFISLYVQLVALMALVSMLPRVREALVRAPWQTVTVALALVLLVEALVTFWPGYMNGDQVAQVPVPYYAVRGLLECLPIFLLGAAIQLAKGRGQLAVTLLLAAAVVPLFTRILYTVEPEFWLIASILALAFLPPVPVPSLLGRLLQTMASVSLFVYLLHPFVVHLLLYATAFKKTHGNLVTISAALLCSYLIAWAAKRGFDWLDGRLLRRAAPAGPAPLRRHVPGQGVIEAGLEAETIAPGLEMNRS